MTLEELNRKTAGLSLKEEQAFAIFLWLSLRRVAVTNATKIIHFVDPQRNPEVFAVVKQATAMAKGAGVLSEFRTILNNLPILEIGVLSLEGYKCKRSSKKSTKPTKPSSMPKGGRPRTFAKREKKTP